MEIQQLYDSLLKIEKPTDNSFNVLMSGSSYYGINKDGFVTFILESNNRNLRSYSQQTNHLFLGTNIKCFLKELDEKHAGVYDILICYSIVYENIISFLQLTKVFSKTQETSPISIKTFFDSLKKLFANKKQLPLSELQGLFGELYFMDYIQNENFDITKYWQSREKLKFDFSITNHKKIEVKTTTGDNRIHKFRHEQLVSDIYDTWIVSIMLRKDDKGLSLYELSEKIKANNPLNLNLHTRITNLLNNYSREELELIVFNEAYAKSNIGFYRTSNIPKFPDKQPEGVTNTEYDSDLTSIEKSDSKLIIEWIVESLK